MRALAVEVESSMTPIHHPATSASDENVYNYYFLFDTSAACSRGMAEVSGNETRVSLPGQTLRARLTGDEREREKEGLQTLNRIPLYSGMCIIRNDDFEFELCM